MVEMNYQPLPVISTKGKQELSRILSDKEKQAV
jgi:hypothetical protein